MTLKNTTRSTLVRPCTWHLTTKDFYELATRFEEASGKLPWEEGDALATCCATIMDRLHRIIRHVA